MKERNLMKGLAAIGIAIILAIFIGESAIANGEAVSEQKISSPSSLVNNKTYEKLIDKITLERKSLADESKRQFEIVKYVFERERSAFANLLEKALWLFGILAAGVASLISFIFIRIYGEQKSLREKFIQDTKSELDQLDEQSKSIRDAFRDKLNELEKLKEGVSQKEEEISLFLSEQNKYKSKNIIWVYGEDGIRDASIIGSLKSKDIKNVHEVVLGASIHIDETSYQAIVFSISKKENINPEFERFLSELKLRGEPALVVYTYNEGQQVKLSKDEWNVLDKYDNYTVANFPGSLQATLNNILRWQ